MNVGVIGYSEGDGHPYSFSAIINGYDFDKMKQSPYPGIANYLSWQPFYNYGVGRMKVTHAWAQDKGIARNIADCTHIDHVVDDYKSMTDEVDIVLVLRDDAESHYEITSHFLEKGKVVFVDKPLTKSLEELRYYQPWLEKGKLMSCSGFRYYPKIQNGARGILDKDDIVFSHSTSIIDWHRYGIHVLEGISPLMGADIEWVQNIGEEENEVVRIAYRSGKNAVIQVNTKIGFVLRSAFYTGSGKHQIIDYDDNFSCFRGILWNLHQQIMTGKPAINPDETVTLMKTLYAGAYSRNHGGEKVYIDQLTI